MTTAEFLSELREAKVRVWLDGEQLRCKAPRGTLTRELADRIAARKAELVNFLRSAEAGQSAIPPPRRYERGDELPLSFAQERLWFLDRLEPGSSAYNLTASRRFEADLDLDLLQRALDAVARRHEVLRTTFPSRGGRPVQLIGPPAAVPLAVDDLRGRAARDRDAALDDIDRDESHRAFDLERGPVFRARLVRLDEAEYVLYLSIPHIIGDGWSMGVLWSELNAVYEALAGGAETLPAEPPVQYGDFVLWQREWLTGETLNSLIDYWKGQIEGAPMMLPLLARHRRSRSTRTAGAVREFHLDAQLTEAIKRLSRHQQVTDFVTLFSVYALVLARYSAVSTVLVGTAVANRNWVEFEDLVGLFVNTLALRADCRDSDTVAGYLRQNHRTLLEAYSHQDMPFEKLVEAVNPERSPGVPPIFQATFVYQNTPLSTAFSMISGGSMFDLTCYFWDGQDGFEGSFEYNPEVLEPAMVEALVTSFRVVAEAFVGAPDTTLGDVSVLDEAEHRRLLVDWNATAVDFRRDATLVSVFDEVVRADPDAAALVDGETTLSYRQLDESANRLARLLIERGVASGDRVALCLGRSLDMPMAILATLKAGAVYVPLDPEFPVARLRLKLKDSGARAVLLDGEHDLAAQAGDAAIIRFDRIADELAALPATDPGRVVAATDPAYIMYTSGSTGTPKGVIVTHRNVLRLVDGNDFVDFGPDQVFLLLAPAYFDASTFELWGAWLHGARGVVYPERVPSMATLERTIREHGVTGLFLTTALFNTIVDTAPESLRTLRWLLFGGEAHSADHVRRAVAALPDTQVVHVYGPTECTTFATARRLPRDPAALPLPVPIGGPIANTTAYVVDPAGRPCPTGVAGELLLGGDGVAAGYWQRPELTAERFVSLAIDGGEPRRLYRTGDQVRWLPSGELEFVGRSDFQVKVRGFRIELGEIETALRAVPTVGDAVVVVREDAPGVRTLVAYVVPDGGDRPDPDRLRAALAERLPDYMLPAAFVVLDQLPLTDTGKVDRRALPPPGSGDRSVAGDKEAPSTPLEVQIAALWEQALEREDIGLDDNFFDVGGNSLIAVRLFAQLEKVTGEHLPLATLFERPTIRALAQALTSEGWEPQWDSLVAIQPFGTRTPIFLVPGVGGNVLAFARLAKLLGRQQPLYGLQSRGLDGKRPPFRRATEMAAHFVSEIRRVRPHGPYILGGACMGGVVAYEMAQQLRRAGEEVSTLMLIETAAPTSLDPNKRRLSALLHPLLFLAEAAKRHLRALRGLSLREKWRYLLDKTRIVGEMIEQRDVYRGDKRVFYRDLVSNANYEVMATYVPENYPGHIHLFLASERPIEPASDTRMTWCELAEKGCSVNRVDAQDSGRMFMEPWVNELAEQIQTTIGKGGDTG